MNNYSVPAIERMNIIINLLENETEGMSIASISESSGIAKTTCLRLLASMTRHGFLHQDARGRFRLGTRFIRLGEMARESMAWLDELERRLKEFAAEIGEIAKISVLEDDHALVLLRAEAPRPLRISISSGSTFPLHAGGASKLLLAGLPPAEREILLPTKLPRYTSNTICEKKRLAEELDRIREQGFALDNEEYLEGLIAVAVPIELPDRTGALSVSFLKPENPEKKINTILPGMREFVDRVSSTLFSSGS